MCVDCLSVSEIYIGRMLLSLVLFSYQSLERKISASEHENKNFISKGKKKIWGIHIIQLFLFTIKLIWQKLKRLLLKYLVLKH